jgi:hypothetical protein
VAAMEMAREFMNFGDFSNQARDKRAKLLIFPITGWLCGIFEPKD